MAETAPQPPPGATPSPALPPPEKRPKLGDFLSHFYRLLNADLGDSPTRTMETLSYVIRLTRETVRELARTRCFLRANALAYSTILSLVPLLAMVMALLSMPALSGHQHKVINQIVDALTPGIDQERFWGSDEEIVRRYIRVTYRDPVTAKTEEVVGEQIADGVEFAYYPEDDQAIKIKRQIGNEEAKDAAANFLVCKVSDLVRAYPAADAAQRLHSADGRIDVIGLDDRGNRKAFLLAYLQNFTSKAGAVGVIGFFVLMYIVYTMLSRIENTFSEIWGIAKRRTFFQRVALYTALVFWGPIAMIAASAGLEFVAHMGFLPGVLLRLLSVLITMVVLTSVYIILPNTQVKIRAAATGGLFAGILWMLATYGFSSYITMTSGGSYQKVYGTLGLLPMILILIYMAWVILLFGAVVSFTIQNFRDLDRKYMMQHRAEDAQIYMALRLFVEVVRQFRRLPAPATGAAVHTAGPPPKKKPLKSLGRTLVFQRARDAASPLGVVAGEVDVPPYAVEAIAQKLVEAGLMLDRPDSPGDWLPAKDPDQIPVYRVLQAVRPKMMAVPAKTNHPERDGIAQIMKALGEAEVGSLQGLTVGELARQLDQRRLTLQQVAATAESAANSSSESDQNDSEAGAPAPA